MQNIFWTLLRALQVKAVWEPEIMHPGSLKQPWPDPGFSLRLSISITIGEPSGRPLYHRWQLVHKKHCWLEGEEERTTSSSHIITSQQDK